MEIFDINLLNWLEKYAGECRYLKITVKCLKYENIKIKDLLIDVFQSFLKEQTKIAEEFLKKIMEKDHINDILGLKKPSINESYLEILANMTIFKDYAILTHNPWDQDKYDLDILNKIKNYHKNNKWVNEIIDEALNNNKKEDNIHLMNDFCNRYEDELAKAQDELCKEEQKSLEEMEKQYNEKKQEIEEQRKMCLLGTPVNILEQEKRIEEIRNDFVQKTQEKRRIEMPYGHLFRPFLKKESIKGKWPEKKKREMEKINFKSKIKIYE